MSFRLESLAEPIPGYKLIERLGSGGFGEVWKAEAPGGLLKAIKFVYGDLDTSDSDGVRAEQELKSLGRVKMVRHPYILSLERFDIIHGQLMIVMELADRNLWDRFRDCRTQGLLGIPRPELLGYLEEAAEALDLMNSEYQLQHLDIKPQNLFLVYNHVKVADFGLVKALQGRVASVTGGVTPIYAAPEMFDGWVSRFCDQYSLAIVYQELLTGQRPFTANNVHQLIMQHVQGKPNLSSLPPEEQEVVGRALSKTPEERYPTCADLVKALQALGAPPALAAAVAVPVSPPDTTHVTPARTAEPAGNGPGALAPAPAPTPPPCASIHPGANGSHQAADEAPTHQARTEVRGEGELVPALVVGVGQAGLGALQQLHQVLVERFGTRDAVPHIRLLYLDTDPGTLQAATDGAGPVLPRHEVLLAKLNRASYYLKPREGRPAIEAWFTTSMLYRIQRNQVTGGLRALGRLAFFDNYRAITQRLRDSLESCADPDTLAAAVRHTGLALRSNRPRVYVVTGLAGGTGGGIFIDLAYVARSLLRQLGHARPEVIGALLLPAAANAGRTMALGNAYAALTELHHFSAPQVTFTARYDSREPPLTDPEPPFTRCLVLPLPEANSEAPALEVAGLLSQFLYRDLLTPLGRLSDGERARHTDAAPGPRVSSFGMYRFSWPRRTLLQRVARRLCQQLVRRWMSKDGKPLQAAVRELVQEQWAKLELAADSMIARLQTACERGLGMAPESAFTAAIGPLGTADRARGAAADVDAVTEAINQLEHLVGRPSELAVLNRPGVLEEMLAKEADAVVADWGDKLAKLTLPLVEQPQFRLAGAEEAIRQVVTQIEQVLQHHEPLCQELTEKAVKADERLDFLRQNLREILGGGRRTAPVVAELFELLRLYPKWRYQGLVLRRVNMAYTSLRGYLSDQVRDVTFCRVRLGELVQGLEGRAAGESSGGETPGRCFLFPAGCQSLDDMVERFVAGLNATDFEDLDRRVQQMIRQQFRALSHVCTASANLLRNLQAAMVEEAMDFAGGRLADDDVVAMYLSRHASEAEAVEHLAGAFREAAPKIAGPGAPGRAEIAVLAAPASLDRDRLCTLAEEAADKGLVEAASPDDIVVYRECAHLPLADLEQVGPAGAEAYRQMAAAEHFTPHCRIDIVDWQMVTPE
ncbi:MAG TPA: tubulin-like doman-containing protein [Gemmataceae bacterium]|nr:tubulin-like doman-containing protein [Gemmataceae bacterium]